jgi:hypothetical protein
LISPLISPGPLLMTVQHSEEVNGVLLQSIDDQILRIGHNKLASVVYAPGTAYFRKVNNPLGRIDDLQRNIAGRSGILACYVFSCFG